MAQSSLNSIFIALIWGRMGQLNTFLPYNLALCGITCRMNEISKKALLKEPEMQMQHKINA